MSSNSTHSTKRQRSKRECHHLAGSNHQLKLILLLIRWSLHNRHHKKRLLIKEPMNCLSMRLSTINFKTIKWQNVVVNKRLRKMICSRNKKIAQSASMMKALAMPHKFCQRNVHLKIRICKLRGLLALQPVFSVTTSSPARKSLISTKTLTIRMASMNILRTHKNIRKLESECKTGSLLSEAEWERRTILMFSKTGSPNSKEWHVKSKNRMLGSTLRTTYWRSRLPTLKIFSLSLLLLVVSKDSKTH
jgi:hypothetical protein